MSRLAFFFAALLFPPAGTPGSVAYGDETTEQAAALSSRDDTLRATFAREIAPLMERNCSGCHGERKQEAELRFDELSPAMSLDQDVSVWSSVRDALNSHEMPPPEETLQPSEQERQRIVDWIDTSFEQVAQRHRANRSSPMRRLTVTEYENTLQALFGAAVPFGKKLPVAPLSEYGYSRDAALLGVSALELEYFLDIARQSVDDYVIFGERIEIDLVPFGLDVNANLCRIDAQRAILNAGADARTVAKESLQAFMERAYRRSISPTELDSMMSLYDQFVSEGDSFQDALKETFSTVLISDPFLYIATPIREQDHPFISEEERRQLASRLSYFLWNGPPDDRLLELASRNQLSDPATLATEVSRMLRDSRARRFSERFAREWLRLDKYALVAVNPEFYPYYDEDLGNDMIAETITTFQEIFHGDRDARELISSDAVYVNQRLARHYGLPPVTGGELQAVPVPDYRTRGGLLHQGAILTMTADGAESNPIYRGVWILERLLNDPPPPPPPAVPPLEASSADFRPLTLKQKIELHREQSACAACHAKIDPWGLALEHFDAIGAWREEALVINPDTAAQTFSPVDSSTVLTTGEKIEGSSDLVSYLSERREEDFTRSLTWHMMTYALARAPNLGDDSELKAIHRHFRTSGYRLSALVLAIVQSEVFQATSGGPVMDREDALRLKNVPTATPTREKQ